jgi:hypothetical protein
MNAQVDAQQRAREKKEVRDQRMQKRKENENEEQIISTKARALIGDNV